LRDEFLKYSTTDDGDKRIKTLVIKNFFHGLIISWTLVNTRKLQSLIRLSPSSVVLFAGLKFILFNFNASGAEAQRRRYSCDLISLRLLCGATDLLNNTNPKWSVVSEKTHKNYQSFYNFLTSVY